MKPSTHLARGLESGFLLLSVLVLLCPVRASDAQSSASGVVCPDSDVRVIAADARDFHDACTGAKGAVGFFAAQGLQSTESLVLEVTPELPVECGPTAVGCYLEQLKQVFILSYTEFQTRKTWFNLPIDRDLYRSAAVHETAHAVAASNFAIPRPTIQATEYVAYVPTFATMNTLLRARVLRVLPGNGFGSEDRITGIFYLFDPMHFGAESYRHYMKPENGPTFLQSVLAGRALTE
jgi:hypothetical protein